MAVSVKLSPSLSLLGPVLSSGIRALAVRGLYVSTSANKDPGRPQKNGDKGPGRNYKRKMNKKLNKTESEAGVSAESILNSLTSGKELTNLNFIERNPTPEDTGELTEDAPVIRGQDYSKRQYKDITDNLGVNKEKESGLGENNGFTDVVVDSLLQGIKSLESDKQDTGADLKGLLSDMKLKVEDDEDKDPGLKEEVPREMSWDPAAGPRLGLFEIPGPGVEVMPPGKPTHEEMEMKRRLAKLNPFKPWCHYDEVPTYPRQFPIDNENYDQGAEAHVGFKDHVLLDHLLDGFPKKGPVRHFMELVVTGLSKNPHYTAAEKRSVVAWYKNYFEQFSVEDLQSVKSVKQV